MNYYISKYIYVYFAVADKMTKPTAPLFRYCENRLLNTVATGVIAVMTSAYEKGVEPSVIWRVEKNRPIF